MKPPNDLQLKGAAVEEWVDLRFFRPIGIRIARALLPTGISADQVTLWRLLQPERIGLQLTEGFMMDPEASVSALVLHHPQARYFAT